MQDKTENPFNIEITNPNHGKGYIERDGKYYLQLIDGEIEYTLEEIKQSITAFENMQKYHDIAITKYPKIIELPYKSIPKEFSSTIYVDLSIDKLMEIYSKNIEIYGIKNILLQIQMMIDIENENISNPLLKDGREVSIYFKTRLETLYNFWDKYEFKTTSAPVEKSKENKKCLFNALQIAIAVTLVNKITGQFPKTISKTDKKFLEDIEREFKIENVPQRVIREYNGLRIDKDFFQNLNPTHKEGVKKILEIKPYTELLKGIK